MPEIDNTLNAVFGMWSWSQVLVGFVIVAVIGACGCFWIDGYLQGKKP